MSRPTHVVERSYELARSGRYSNVSLIRRQLKTEGYTNCEIKFHLEGRSISRDLAQLCSASRPSPGVPVSTARHVASGSSRSS